MRLLLAALAITPLAAIAMSQIASGDHEVNVEFDRKVWTSADWKTEESDIRAPYLPAALELVQPGMSRLQVEELLGAPDEDFGSKVGYYVSTTSFGGEYEVLLIEFDESDNVVRAWQGSSETWQ